MSDFWVQKYDVVMGSQLITSLVDLVPIVYFLLALVVFKMKGHIASFTTMILALLIAVFFNGLPFASATSAAVYGILSGLWPIGWIVIWAIFIYNITVKTGQFDVIRSFIGNVSRDQRVQVLLIAYAFGAFLEGVAGFGIPIAIGASLLLGLGMKNPIKVVAVCLIANMIPAPSGAIGIPITVNSAVTGIDAYALNYIIGKQIFIIALVVPFWLTAMVDGFRGIKEIFPMILLVSILSAGSAWVGYTFIGHELTDIITGVVTMTGIIVFSKVWKPKYQLTTAGHVSSAELAEQSAGQAKEYSLGRTILAWSPFLVVSILALFWTVPVVKSTLNQFTISFELPFLHKLVFAGEEFLPGVTAHEQAGTLSEIYAAARAAVWSFDVIKSVGTALAFSALYTVIAFRANFSMIAEVFVATIKQLIFPILTICFVLGFAKIADYSGQTSGIALLLTNTGALFPLLGPILGMLGVYLTGSVVNSNTLFAKVQVLTASKLGISESLMAASNNIAAIAGKAISPQSVAIGCAATKNQGREGEVLGAVLLHAIVFLVFICALTYVQAYYFPATAVAPGYDASGHLIQAASSAAH